MLSNEEHPEAKAPTRRHQQQQRIEGLVSRLFLSVRPHVAEVRLLSELTMPQLKTLLVLHGTGPLRMSDVAAQLGVGMPTATSLATKLEDKGLVSRQHTREDRRVVMCSITDSGRREAERFWGGWRERVSELVDALSEDELEIVAQGMELIAVARQRGLATRRGTAAPTVQEP